MDEKLRLLQTTQEELTERFKALSLDAAAGERADLPRGGEAQLEKTQEVARVELDARSTAIDVPRRPIREALEKVDGKLTELDQSRERAQGALGEQLGPSPSRGTRSGSRPSARGRAPGAKHPRPAGRDPAPARRRARGHGGPLRLHRADAGGGRGRDRYARTWWCTCPARSRWWWTARSRSRRTSTRTRRPTRDEAARLAAHAADVRRHVRKLSEKSYASQFESAPEFVVMFMPGEAFLFAALEKDPEPIEFGAEQNVILATPTTLIALLRAVAYGWRQEQVARERPGHPGAGRELHDRLQTVVRHRLPRPAAGRLGGRVQLGDQLARGPGPGHRSEVPGARRRRASRTSRGSSRWNRWSASSTSRRFRPGGAAGTRPPEVRRRCPGRRGAGQRLGRAHRPERSMTKLARGSGNQRLAANTAPQSFHIAKSCRNREHRSHRRRCSRLGPVRSPHCPLLALPGGRPNAPR